ncbi:hypothetical protein Pint_07340 [Pistacia integerrima]|uniref:Uncharacterized protein n=1 Tax=Pistacia integerrima TaxID=434235 RepID=A0ACC0XY82_9ROSI|nr:hypothetical protein Pint_07340 [Pistacia integerrima]
MKQFSGLKQLFLSNCNMLQSLPELPWSLSYLEAINCKQLQSLPEIPSSPEKIDASEVEKLMVRISFIFTNCHSLDEKAMNVLASAPLRFQRMASAQEDKPTRFFNFCLPGSELPTWVHYQSSGSSLTFDLPQNWCFTSFIGFAIWAVIAFDESFETRDLYVSCNCYFETNDGERVDFSCNFNVIVDYFQDDPDHMVSINSDHVVFGSYFDAEMARLLKSDHTAVTFEFGSNYDWTSKYRKVKCCGVCPLYAQAINQAKSKPSTFENFVSQGFGVTGDHVDTHESQSDTQMAVQSDGEEVEPNPKRICTNQIDTS